jgi:hypothetical protein
MKEKGCKILFNVFLYLLFALLWGVILSVLFLMRTFDTFLDRFDDGILLKVFAVTSVIGIVITVLCRKKMKYSWMLPLCLILSTIFTTTMNYGLLYKASDYMSVYTKEKWEKYPYVRYCMLDNLKERYEFIGMTEQEVKEILGEPTYVVEYTGNTKYKGHMAYQYVVGDDRIDGYTYDFIFENGIIVDTSVSQL